ncbi:MAG: hypothetical protein ACK55I_04940, partial [bacterium]
MENALDEVAEPLRAKVRCPTAGGSGDGAAGRRAGRFSTRRAARDARGCAGTGLAEPRKAEPRKASRQRSAR